MFGSKEIHKAITKYEENRKFINNERAWETAYIFYRECMSNPNSPFFIDKTELFPNVAETIEIIREANGLVFIPHVFAYGENSMKIFKELTRKYDIDGIECYYLRYTEEQTQFLLDYCKEHKLYISGGSDYHGENNKMGKLGLGEGNLNISNDIAKEWAKFVNE